MLLSAHDLLTSRAGSLTERLKTLHDRLLQTAPDVDRVACALYDESDGCLRTFVNSTRSGESLQGHAIKLADSPSLSRLARDADVRVLDDLAAVLQANTEHSAWLLRQGYQSSFTVPVYGHGALLGFVFFDSLRPAAFSERVQRDLVMYCNFINLAIANELASLRVIRAAIQLAQDLAGVRDFETGTHLDRMARYSRIIARGVAAERGLSDEFVEHVGLFAPLHDVGKIGIPDHILLKPGKLDDDERVVMESHVDKGLEIIEKIIEDTGLQGLPHTDMLRNIVRCHHEYLDGSGYPRGLRASEIPIEARIVVVADIYDALTCDRPYKQPWLIESALGELQRMVEAGQLDAGCVAALERQRDQIVAVQARYSDLQAADPSVTVTAH